MLLNKKNRTSGLIMNTVIPKTKSEERISQIIEGTFKCIYEKGYSNVTMQAISQYTGLSKGAINHYFKKKEDILVAVLKELDRKLFKNVDEKVRGSEQIKDHLRFRLSGSFELTKLDPTLMYVLLDFLSLSISNDKYGKIVKRFFKKYRYLSSVGVESGLQAGVYRDVNPRDIGVIVVAIIIGIGVQWILDEDGFDYERVTKIIEDMIIKYLEENE